MSKIEISEKGQMMLEFHHLIFEPMMNELDEMGYDVGVNLIWNEDKQMVNIVLVSDNPSEEEMNVVTGLYKKYIDIYTQ